ncbi:MAG: hypothetical protein AB1760_00130 [Pseudomonadota bacterium]
MRLNQYAIRAREQAIEALTSRYRLLVGSPIVDAIGDDFARAVADLVDEEGQTAMRLAWTMIAAGVQDPEVHSFDARLQARLEAVAAMGGAARKKEASA